MARSYSTDLPGGTATTSIQMQGKQTLKNATVSVVSTAAGKLELSTIATSQIGTAAPTEQVLFRLTKSGTAAGAQVWQIPINLTVAPFQTIYIHESGAGLGSITLS